MSRSRLDDMPRPLPSPAALIAAALAIALLVMVWPSTRATAAGPAAPAAVEAGTRITPAAERARRDRQDAAAPVDPGGSAPEKPSSVTRETALWNGFIDGLAKGIDGLPRLPSLVSDFGAAWSERDSGSDAVGRALLVSAVGCFAGLLVYALLSFLARRRLGREPADFVSRFKLSALHLALDAAGLAAMGVAGHLALTRLLPELDIVRKVAAAGLITALACGVYIAAGRFLLSPTRPERRLMPLPHAAWHMRMILGYGLLGPGFSQSVVVLRDVAGDPLALTGWILLGATLLTLFKVAWFWLGRHDIAALVNEGGGHGHEPSLLRRAGAVALPWLYIAVACLIWAAAQIAADTTTGTRLATPAGITQNLTVVLPILATGVSALVASITRRALEGRNDPLRVAFGAVAGTLATGIVWVASLAVLVRLWGEYLVDPVSAEAVGALRLLTRAGLAIVTGWAIWTFCKTYFDAAAPDRARGSLGPGDEEAGAHVATRLATVLPLVRNLVLGAVLAVTALGVLGSLGIEIAPLLAGFGVIGLAISFGSQALVRDIVSGIFFMTDDAFRVGEYVDTGRLKGTVEKITVRSVQLRHQNGQVHTIPFGQLQAITNFSRDWSTVKFQLRLDREADVELARRAIKRVGAEMMQDPEFGQEFIQPLKMQGIQDITDTAIVIRCKFTCRPVKPTWLQREALKRIHRTLSAAGVPFASNAVSFRDGHAHPTNAAAAATATSTSAANAAG